MTRSLSIQNLRATDAPLGVQMGQDEFEPIRIGSGPRFTVRISRVPYITSSQASLKAASISATTKPIEHPRIAEPTKRPAKSPTAETPTKAAAPRIPPSPPARAALPPC